MTINEALKYDPETGKLYWKITRGGVRSGDEAGWNSGHGYKRLSFNKVMLYCHRVAWFLYYGRWPVGEIDHINQIRDDNRICNLRECDKNQNHKNKKKSSGKTCRSISVSKHSSGRGYMVQIHDGHGSKFRKYFRDTRDA